MDSPSIADAVAKATPDVAKLLDQHARSCAPTCHNLPSSERDTCQNLPSADGAGARQSARTRPNLPEPAGTCRDERNDKTNPFSAPRPPRPLNDRQLVAARWMVAGYGSVEIAYHLRVNRHTVAEWKRQPAFAAELQRLRDYCAAALVARPAPPAPRLPSAPTERAPATPPARRMTRAEIEQEDRECEAMIARSLQARAGRS